MKIVIFLNIIIVSAGFLDVAASSEGSEGALPCNSNLDCQQDVGPFAVCVHGNCVCHEKNSTDKNVKCGKIKNVFALDEDCELSVQCNVVGSHCDPDTQKCTCNKSLIASGRKEKCLKVAENLHEPCEIDRQCHINIPSSNCVRNQCDCRIGYHEYNGLCWKSASLHYTCNSTIECMPVENSVCEENQCQCLEGFVPSPNSKRCMKIVAEFGVNNTCTEHEQCASFGNYAQCKDSKCDCHYSYHYVPHLQQCIINKRLYENCTRLEECFHGSEENKMTCHENQCKCVVTYVEKAGICIDSGSTYKSISGIILIVLGLTKLL